MPEKPESAVTVVAEQIRAALEAEMAKSPEQRRERSRERAAAIIGDHLARLLGDDAAQHVGLTVEAAAESGMIDIQLTAKTRLGAEIVRDVNRMLGGQDV